MPSVTIGPEFFKKEFNEYEDWHWAWVREISQNSIDCGSTKIEIDISEIDGETHVTVLNNGDPMTEDILINKLLALGSSGKNFAGSVGGFGKAKNILMFCHKSWSVASGTIHVSGIGGDYEIDTIDHVGGTRTTVVMDGSHASELRKAARKFAKYAQWDGSLLLDGEQLSCDQSKGSRRRDLGFGVVYTNKSDQYVCVVRIGGIPMFVQHCGHDRLVIVELTGKSDDLLTSNRDGLVRPFRGELSSFITELAVDKKSALRPSVPKYTRFAGRKLGHSRHEVSNVRSLVAIPQELAGLVEDSEPVESDPDLGHLFGDDGMAVELSRAPVGSVRMEVKEVRSKAAAYTQSTTEDRPRVVTIGEEFVIKNETDLVVPDYYRPDSGEFSTYSQKLIRIWGRLMLELHRMFDHEAEFAVGFIFDSSSAAEHEGNGPYGRVYYINPAEVVEQRATYSKSFKKRWKFDNAGKKMLLAIAAHEFVHGLGYDWHAEDFANEYTTVVGEILRDHKRFNWCFK